MYMHVYVSGCILSADVKHSTFSSQTHLYTNLTWSGSLCVFRFDLGNHPGLRADG